MPDHRVVGEPFHPEAFLADLWMPGERSIGETLFTRGVEHLDDPAPRDDPEWTDPDPQVDVSADRRRGGGRVDAEAGMTMHVPVQNSLTRRGEARSPRTDDPRPA